MPATTPTNGPLGQRAVAELRAIAQARDQMNEQFNRSLAVLAAKEAMVLTLTAEAAGCDSDGPFDYDIDTADPSWRVAGA